MAYSLGHLRDSEFNGVKDLADAAERILRSAGPSQGKGTVTEYPNARTIRYYLTEGLLPQPMDKRGPTSIFGYGHLLTLLVIKKLQSDGLPINVIKTLIAYKDATELEALLNDDVHLSMDERSLNQYRQSHGHTDDSEIVVFDNDEVSLATRETAPPKNDAQSYLESLLFRKPKQPRDADASPLFSMAAPHLAPMFGSEPEPPPASAESWDRYTIAPGVEIHLEKNYQPPETEPERSHMIKMIRRILRFRSRK